MKNLQEELSTTIKEPVSVYFDSNPHDGLLETHNVDKSLEGKLKCLIFIPILSQTYCDTKSFAWQHEFCPFNKLAQKDQFARDIRLGNGNVASRILPVKIHDLDIEDKSFLKNELGGVLRAIEFIYKEVGVNRPLKSSDNKNDNLNKTDYRNQINKLANAVKEIIRGIIKPPSATISRTSPFKSINVSTNSKSVAVLPFVNMSNEPDQEYFSDGLTEEIIADLSKISELLVISRSSIMTFKGTGKTIKEIANEVNVRYILEGSVRKAGNNLRITAQLIDAVTDAHVWAEKYSGTLEDVFDIQEKVSRAIVEELKIKLTSMEDKIISERPINNALAYDCYLHARSELVKWTKEAIDQARKHIQNGMDIIGPNATLYGGMAYVYYNYANMGFQKEDGWNKAEHYVAKTFELDPQSPEGHLVMGLLFQTIKGNQAESIKHFKKVLSNLPNNLDALFWLSFGYLWVGKTKLAKPLINKMLNIDPLSANVQIMPGVTHLYEGHFDLLEHHFSKAYNMEPQNPMINLFVSFGLAYRGRKQEAILFINNQVKRNLDDFFNKIVYALGYALQGEIESTKKIMQQNDIKSWACQDVYLSYLFAVLFALTNQTAEALDWLERSVDRGFVNYPFLSTFDPLLNRLKEENRFQQLMQRVKREWEMFEG